MYLKRIEIYGFKSFAQKTVLDFDYKNDGNITAVVGPNGSGKSNVADAIRWVTGEQSSKNLRSKKSEDVIFCGSAAKPRGSYAEVTIVLASDKLVKFELNGKEHSLAEIEVARKLYRSGESEYLINQKKVRLTDVQQLLASLGFGQSSYTVIGQGMVDRLLFFTASERKVLFDEAAGVKQYEIKREQSLRKLESTDANLIRLRDILSELEPRVVNLRRLVKRAEGRKEYEDGLTETQQKYFGSLLYEYNTLIYESEKKKTELSDKINRVEQRISELQDKIDTKSENLHTKERTSLESQITACTAERDELMRQVSYLTGKVESYGHNKSLISSKRAELESEKASLSGKIDFLKAKIEDEQAALDKALTSKRDLEKPVLEVSAEVQALEQSLREPVSDRTGQIVEMKSRLEELTSKKLAAEQATIALKELEKQEKALTSEILTAKSEQKKIQTEADKLQLDLAKLEGEFRKLSSLVNPSTLSSLEKAMVEVENMKPEETGFIDKLNKLFVQFRDISKAVNNEEREKLESEISRIRRAAGETSEKLVSLRIYLGTRESRQSQIRVDITSNKQKLIADDKGEDEITRLQKELAKYEGTMSERQNILLRQKDELQVKLATKRDALHIAELEYNRLNPIVTNQQSELAGAERRLELVNGDLGKIETQEVGQDEATLTEKLKVTQRELSRKEEDLAKLRGGLTQVITREREQDQINLVYEREKRALQDEKSIVLAQLSSLEVEAAKTQVRLEDLNEEIRLGGIVVGKDAKYEYLDQMEKDVLKLKMENIRRKLETTAGVDPETEAEYHELEARATEMATQVMDLTKAKDDLTKVVSELDERIKHQFSDVFKNIATEFNRYFTMLFGGGNAKLELGEDEEGSFGIEISANPPGKRVQTLTALSGGERTLTSLALLFAILSVNPSPFVVLDEVDAALDESNTVRFIKILEDLAKKTQFIIISHNRDTMRCASSLYGVTMDESHISKLLSVKLTEALTVAKS